MLALVNSPKQALRWALGVGRWALVGAAGTAKRALQTLRHGRWCVPVSPLSTLRFLRSGILLNA